MWRFLKAKLPMCSSRLQNLLAIELRLFSHLHNANMRDFVGDIARIKGESLVSQLAHSAWHMIQVQEV